MHFFYSSVFFAGTTAFFIVLWVKARQDAKDWQMMSRVGVRTCRRRNGEGFQGIESSARAESKCRRTRAETSLTVSFARGREPHSVRLVRRPRPRCAE